MFPFFGFNRTRLFEESMLGPPRLRKVMKQVQAGLLLVDATNSTMRDTFFTEWANCADNYDCLIPDNITIDKNSHPLLSNMYMVEEYGARVFRRVCDAL